MKKITLLNKQIHEEAQITQEEFSHRIQNITQIRTGKKRSFAFYPTEMDLERNKGLWEFINGNQNALNDEFTKYLVLTLPEWLYLFLRYTPWVQVENAIVVALTGLYAIKPEERPYMEEYITPDLLKRIEKNFKKYFSDFENIGLVSAEDIDFQAEINAPYYTKEKEFSTRFDYYFRDYCSNPLILPYLYPLLDVRYMHYTQCFMDKGYDRQVELECSYFSSSDWENIIVHGKKMNIVVAESKEEPWQKWISNYNNN